MNTLAFLSVLAILSLSISFIVHTLYANRTRIAEALAGVPAGKIHVPSARTSRVARAWALNNVRVKSVPLRAAA